MKRYYFNAGIDGEMVKNKSGPWVRFEHVEQLLGKLGHDVGVTGFHYRIYKLESIECNCQFMADTLQRKWVCPAHGYKKL